MANNNYLYLKNNNQSLWNFYLQLELSLLAMVAVGRHFPAAMLLITAERVLMAVILLVEDDAFICELAEMMIQDWGHQTLSASDSDEALLFLRSPQNIDALFTDLYLKTTALGGCDLAHLAIKLRPQLHVLYTTGNFVTDAMKALFVEGAHCLCKPYTPYQLQCSIENLLAA